MSHLFRHIAIVDPGSPQHGQTTDILIDNGIISRIAKGQKPSAGTIVIDAKGWQAMPGFCDVMVDFCDPGHEYRDDLRSGLASAASGGFTAVCTIADTSPPVQEKSNVEYILSKAKGNVVEVWPLGAVTEKLEGKNPTEMMDMFYAGAVAFSDAPYAICDSGVMLRAMQYAHPLGSVIFSVPYDPYLSADGQVNEGITSVKMGFRGIPAMSESLAIYRDIELARYAGTRLHICGVSTAEGAQMIREAKKDGLPVTTTAFLHHLLLTEEAAIDYDTNFKVFPPLRTEKDRKALVKAVADGTIDTISTQHTPLDTEAKMLEFEYALPGIIGLETAYALLKSRLDKQLSDEVITKTLSQNARKILRKSSASLVAGSAANITFVDPNERWTVDTSSLRSKSRNTPFLSTTLTGRVKGLANNGLVVIF